MRQAGHSHSPINKFEAPRPAVPGVEGDYCKSGTCGRADTQLYERVSHRPPLQIHPVEMPHARNHEDQSMGKIFSQTPHCEELSTVVFAARWSKHSPTDPFRTAPHSTGQRPTPPDNAKCQRGETHRLREVIIMSACNNNRPYISSPDRPDI